MDNEAQTFEDRFLDAVLDKGPIYGLIGAGILALFIAVEQIILAVTK